MERAEASVRRLLHVLRPVGVGSPAWCAAPQLWVSFDAGRFDASSPFLSRRLAAVARGPQRWRRQWWMRGEVLFAAETLNQKRNLLPLTGETPDSVRRERIGRVRIGIRSAWRAERDVQRLERAEPGLTEAQLGRIHHLLTEADVLLDVWRHILRRTGPRLVTIASQNQPSLRALISAASERGIPTMYLPHAPVADDPIYADLPCDLAVLRGEGEVEWYRHKGADPDHLTVGGNPSLSLPATVGAEEHPPILAISPWYDVELSDLIARVAEATTEEVCVAPHPLSDFAQVQRLIPAHWSVYRGGRTYDLLTRVDAPVMQVSSGLGLEALLLGRKVIQLDFAGAPRLYPYICEPHVRCVADARELTAALGEDTSLGRRERQEWASRWSSPTGSAAVEACRRSLAHAQQLSPTRFALDGWATRDE
jgi:hypothetical protein